MKTPNRKRQYSGIIIFFLMGIVAPIAILSAFEFLLSVFGVISNYELKESGLASVNIIQTPLTMMISDPVLGWGIMPNSKKVSDGIEYINNSYGLRGDEIKQPKGKDTFRILCFGDSSTYGVFVPFDDIYSMRLQKKLREHFKSRNVEVINAGVLGYATLQIYALLDSRLKDLQPDLVTISSGVNDASTISEEMLEDKKIIPLYGDLLSTLKYYGDHSRLICLLSKLIFKSSDPLAPLPLPKNLDVKMAKRRVSTTDYEQNLIKICQKAKELSAKTMFLAFSLPPEYQRAMLSASLKSGAYFVDAESALQSYYAAHRDRWLSSSSDKDLPIQTDPYYENVLGKNRMKIRRDHMLFVDSCHPNSLGHAIISNTIFEVMVNELLICK